MSHPQLASPPTTRTPNPQTPVATPHEVIQLSQTPPPSSIDQTLHEAEKQVDSSPASSKVMHQASPPVSRLQTTVFIEYGENLQEKLSVHLEALVRKSKKSELLFSQAQGLRRAYTESMMIRKKVKALLPVTIFDDFPRERADKAMEFVHLCVKNYPLSQYRVHLKAALASWAEKLFEDKKLIKGAASNGSLKKKDWKERDLLDRLQELNTEGVRVLSQVLHKKLNDIKIKEVLDAQLDMVKAAAQRRILLPGYNRETILSVNNWIYDGPLHYTNAEHLCDIYGLSEELGIQDLAKTCIDILSTAAESAIDKATAEGVGLRQLLEDGVAAHEDQTNGSRRPLDHVVPIVFKFALFDKNAPIVLRDMVINAVAESNDIEVFELLSSGLTLEMALQLIKALMLRATPRGLKRDLIKSEHEDEEALHKKARLGDV